MNIKILKLKRKNKCGLLIFIWIYGTKAVIIRFNLRRGEYVEEGGFSKIEIWTERKMIKISDLIVLDKV